MNWLEDNCPRLFKAHRQRRVEISLGVAYPAAVRWINAMEGLQRVAIRGNEAMKKMAKALEEGRLRP